MHNPFPEQFIGQSKRGMLQNGPANSPSQMQTPLAHCPWPLQLSGQVENSLLAMEGMLGVLHSAPVAFMFG